MLLCPKCGAKTAVIHTGHDGVAIYRRRRCSNDHRFNTIETVDVEHEPRSIAEQLEARKVRRSRDRAASAAAEARRVAREARNVQIRAATGTLRDIAAKFGVSISTAYAVRTKE